MVRFKTLRQSLAENIDRLIARHGWKGIMALSFYPLVAFVMTPLRLVETLLDCKALIEGKNWQKFSHFTPLFALTNLFYWTISLNLAKYGRTGRSPSLGLGNYNLSQCFHYTLPSLYAYCHAGCVCLLFGNFFWWLSHFLWLDQPQMDPVWLLSVMGLAIMSATFYGNTFASQNYNILGWMFFPTVLYGWLTGHWVLATLACLGASLASFTVVFIAALLALPLSLSLSTPLPALSVLPACLKLATHFFPNILQHNFKRDVKKIADAIGFKKENVKYRRKGMTKFGPSRFYYLLIYVQFIVLFYIGNNALPIITLVSVMIWIINSNFARFADAQTMAMLVFSAATTDLIQIENQNLLLLASYWILASPAPFLLVEFTGPIRLTVVPPLRPFNISPILDGMQDFLAPVSEGERVLMVFDDPHGEYEKIFDGYRALLEVPLYVSSLKGIHFMPDWWGVFELNYEGEPDFWGRNLDNVKKQMKYWDADYVVIYQKAGTKLDDQWLKAEFKILRHLSWSTYDHFFGERKPYSGATPDWWLLTKNRNQSRDHEEM